ncbi:TetR/AcrR family transcriptional regulator [Rhodococcus sp. Z13]|uniref:TetR/AcrR family transcriptional regulator n=1 Tax=Rhodococcus sacchari TaxID=2962047 RepID=A0ACD4DHI7_9NOCA|nr:TetR/AcrR family transcriptional regulator [Rhodococcus sp. Z13]UYP19535.1 TetR/AcrR family transcriptional regulator [Rhodococcus sp. Z13]
MSVKPGGSGRVRDAARTRTALLDAAQEVFLRDGYAAAATEEIVAVAGVTRGALYHHFANKRELFRGVVERIQKDAEETLLPEEPVGDPWDGFNRAVLASLDAVYDPATRRLLLIEAPAVLGWAEVRETHRHSSLKAIERMLASLDPDTHERSSTRTSVLAHLLVAAVEEAMLYLAHSDDPVRDRPTVQAELLRLLEAARRPVVAAEAPLS